MRGTIGPDAHDLRSMTILNRIVEWTENGITLEADPRHVDLLLHELGLEKAKGSEVTGTKIDRDDGHPLTTSEATRYRSIAARFNLLAIDRIETQFACK